ncbi:10368_t:CDS:2, partial [Paraglomus brasilianum]
ANSQLDREKAEWLNAIHCNQTEEMTDAFRFQLEMFHQRRGMTTSERRHATEYDIDPNNDMAELTALFHAVRIGGSFITPDVVESLFAQEAHTSELKIAYNLGPPDLLARGQAIFPSTSFPGFSKRIMTGLVETISLFAEMTWNISTIFQPDH